MTVGLGQTCPEGLAGLFGSVPVAARDTGAGDPDLADLSRIAWNPGFGVDDQQVLSQCRLSAAKHRDPTRRLHLPDCRSPLLQGGLIHASHQRRSRFGPPRHVKRRLGKSVARKERLATEPAGRELLGKSREGFFPNGLRAIEGDGPVGQIQGSGLFGRNPLDAQVVDEVRPPARSGPKT